MRAVALALTLLTGTASAQVVAPASELARQERGIVVLTDANRASAAFHVYDSRVGLRGYSLVLAPTVDVFVNRVLTVGGALDLAYENAQASHAFSIGGDARIGAYGMLGARWALWPTLALGVSHDSSTVNVSGVGPSNSISLRARVEAPFLFYPARGFFLGAGPLVGLTGVSHDGRFDRYASFGVITTLGGTF
jgi:hypothetical protein